jgi:hypothetical protein
LEIPEIPEPIVRAAETSSLAIFVGAGVSMLVGGPSWKVAAKSLLEQLAGQAYLSYAELSQFASLSPKIQISIAMNTCRKTQGFKPDLKKVFQPQGDMSDHKVYRDLYSLRTPFVTTNYDDGLVEAQNALTRKPIEASPPSDDSPTDTALGTPRKSQIAYDASELTIDKLLYAGSIAHLHGGLKKPDTMILTTLDYLKHYRKPKVEQFLKRLFEKYTVLFIGYGLEEEEVLDQIIRAGGESTGNEIRHYRLFPRFSHEVSLLNHLSDYYGDFGVQLVDYSIDKKHHAQLEAVIASWAEQLRPRVQEAGKIEAFNFYDEILDESAD